MEHFVLWLQQQAGLPHSADHTALRHHLVDQLGYSNRNKAFRRIDTLLQQHRLDAELREKLAPVLQCSSADIDEHVKTAREARFRQQRETQFATIGPQLVARVPRPTQIFLAGLVSDHKRYRKLPADLPQRSEAEQRAFLGAAIKAFIAQEGSRIPLFGTISGFAYIHAPHAHWLFDTHGQCLGQYNTPYYNPTFMIQL